MTWAVFDGWRGWSIVALEFVVIVLLLIVAYRIWEDDTER
jgi:hypothetical protein